MNKIDLYIPKIRQINILANLSEAEIKELLEFASFHEAEKDEVIFKENDYGTSIYMLISGCVKICKNTGDGTEYEITRLNETEFFGEMSFLDNSVRSANAVSVTNSMLISLDEERFKRFSHRYSYAAFRFLKNISLESQKRIRQTNDKLLHNYEALLKTHNELAENRNFLYNVIRSSSEIIIILDASLKVLIFNSGAEQNLKASAVNAVSKSAENFFAEGEYQKIMTALLAENKSIYNNDVYLRDIDGQKILTNFSAFVIKSQRKQDPSVQAAVMIASNITQKKLLERQIVQNEKMIFLGKIISEIVRDVKNPLAEITAAKDEMMTSPAAGACLEIKTGLAAIENAAAKIHNSILSTLNFAKVVPAGKVTIDLKNVVSSAVDLCMRNIKSRNSRIVYTACHEKAEITGNASQIEQVLINIITNAVDSIPAEREGLVKVELNVKEALVYCMVQDNGCGMDEELAANIFEPFFTARSKSGGSGLGLSICQAIIAQHNGSINCRSKPGEGSVFTVNFNRAC